MIKHTHIIIIIIILTRNEKTHRNVVNDGVGTVVRLGT